ncbi:MAG: translation initiation factor [Thermosediminibacterales bacterium]|nr:translation initiation factor [Thermosediminibacterales bacterium]
MGVRNLSKIRVYELAKNLGISSKKMISILEELDIDIKNHMSTLDEDIAKLVEDVVDEEKNDKQKRIKKDFKKVKQEPSKGKTENKNKKDKKTDSKGSGGMDRRVILPDKISVKELASKINKEPAQVIKKLFDYGVMATINQEIDFDSASIIVEEFGLKAEKEKNIVDEEENMFDIKQPDNPESLVPRPPIVTIMGHVDHGKTSLLDAIRETNVTAQEAGGITQHIGAYKINVDGKQIVFLDTPGHEAFTAMRARGAKVTDISVLVVAADDGVMPQTIEAINHSKAAKVPIIVAINKIDKPNANPDRVKQQLSEHGLIPEDWGGDTICVPVSALKKQGLDNLLEMILLVAEVAELKANPNRPAVGTIIEAKLDRGRGPVATVLVQNGTLKIGDAIVAGSAYGRVRAMIDDKGERVKQAGPSMPVEVLGLSDVPHAGDLLYTVEDDKLARQIADKRKEKQREAEFKASHQKVSLEELFNQIEKGEVKELNIIIKADVQGSVEALKQALERLSNDEVEVKVIHGGVGAITETDIMLAAASNAIVIGFNVRPEGNARKVAEKEQVDVRTYRVIYNAIEDIQLAMKGVLEPKFEETIQGRLEVRAVFKISGVGVIAGCYVLEGKVTRNSQVRVIRDGVIIFEGKVESLKRFKEDVKEVTAGYECGIGLEKFNDIKEGDILEVFVLKEVRES